MEYHELGERFEYNGVYLKLQLRDIVQIATFYVYVDAVMY